MKKRGTRISYSSKIAKRNKKRKFLKPFVLLFVPIGIVVGLVLALRADYLQIKNIEVTGAVSLSNDDIKNAVLESMGGAYLKVLPKSNIFLVDEKNLREVLLSEFGRLAGAEINKGLDGSLRVSVEERQTASIWCSTDGTCFLMDNSGLLFARSSETDKQGKIIFGGNLKGDPLLQTFGTEEDMHNYFEMARLLETGGYAATKLFVESDEKAILNTPIGKIIFSPREENITEAADNALLLIETEKQKNAETIFDYIDTRFGNKLFYKTI